jgi:plastocyanin
MKSRRPIALLATAASIAALVFVTSCGSDTPTGGGGVVPKELDSGTLNNGNQYVHTFNNVGTFNYHCNFHGGMNGQVIVVNGSADSAVVQINNNSFSPTPASVKPGGYVRWFNNGSAHTVTSD